MPFDAEDVAALGEIARRLCAADDGTEQENLIRRYLVVPKRFSTETARLKYFEQLVLRAGDSDFIAICERAGIQPKLRVLAMDSKTTLTRPVRFRMSA